MISRLVGKLFKIRDERRGEGGNRNVKKTGKRGNKRVKGEREEN